MKMQSPPLSVQMAAAQHSVQPNFIPITPYLVKQFKQLGMDNQDDAYYYHVGPHDVLNIHVWNHPELAGPVGQAVAESGNSMATPSLSPVGYLVGPDGMIYYPLVGSVHVAGSTVQENRVKLTKLLTRYIRNPQIDIRVTGFRSKKIYVAGEVLKPGLFPLTDSPISITDAINIAGGMDPKTADPSHIFVIRGDYSHPEVFWLNAQSPDALLLGEDFRLKDRDIVFVSTAPVARWNRAIDQILPSIQTAWFSYAVVTTR
jgi:protein involved in polysaccharide export with SLBB domain